MYLVNAFSLNMLPRDGEYELHTATVDLEKARDLVGYAEPTCAIGHEDLWELIRKELLLADDLENARRTVTLGHRDRLLVAQYRGPRLPEGATQLPEGAEIQYLVVTVLDKAEIAKAEEARANDRAQAAQVAEDCDRAASLAASGSGGHYHAPMPGCSRPRDL